MSEKNIQWFCKKMYLTDLSIRKRRNPYTKNEEEYAVFKVCHEDTFDTFHLARGTKKYFKTYTLMCFREEIYTRVVVGDRFSFKGFASLSYGGTYLVAEKAYDELGYSVETKSSLYHQKEVYEDGEEEMCPACLDSLVSYGVLPSVCPTCGNTRKAKA